MSDEVLCKALRRCSLSKYDYRYEAADRIELLATTNEQLVATNEALTAKLATCEKYRDAYAECDSIGTQAVRDLEAKLAAAVDWFETILDRAKGDYMAHTYYLDALAALATIKRREP
jgi:hypothetical protein